MRPALRDASLPKPVLPQLPQPLDPTGQPTPGFPVLIRSVHAGTFCQRIHPVTRAARIPKAVRSCGFRVASDPGTHHDRIRQASTSEEGTSMADIQVQIPKELGLTRKQKSDLQKVFRKKLVETIHGKQAGAIAKSKLMVIDVRAKSKNEVV
jgi:hypothetical protein